MPATAASRYRRYRSAIQMHPEGYHRDDSPECADVDVHATDYVTDGLDECGYRDTPENHGRLARAWAAAEGNGQDVRAACDSSRLATGLTGAHDAASLTNEDNKVEVTDLIRPLSS